MEIYKLPLSSFSYNMTMMNELTLTHYLYCDSYSWEWRGWKKRMTKYSLLQTNSPPYSSLVNQGVSWSHRTIDDGSLTGEWMTQRQLYYWKFPSRKCDKSRMHTAPPPRSADILAGLSLSKVYHSFDQRFVDSLCFRILLSFVSFLIYMFIAFICFPS